MLWHSGVRRSRPPTLAVLVVAAASLLVVPGAAAGSADVGITLVISGTLGANGWYTSNVTVNWIVTGAANSSGCDAKTLTTDTQSVTLTCTASDSDGTSSVTKSHTFKIDKTPPAAKATASRVADANGWYNRPLTVAFSGTDATAGIAGCASVEYTGPDSSSAAVSGSCTDLAGNVGAASFALKYDATPPTAKATASRAADANGWYNHPLTVAFSGTDATAGIAGCASMEYTGPDSPSAAVSGSCTDLAGNVGAASLPLAYDATPPTLSNVTAKPGNRRIDLKWTASADTQDVEVTRAPGLRGTATSPIHRGRVTSYRDTGLRIGKEYRYTVTGFDQAGNAVSKTIAVTATGPLLSPLPAARVGSTPLLVWTPVSGARYYNLQLVRGGRKILSLWPRQEHFQLPRSWVFDGHRYRLRPGVYRWYVWPGFGRFSAARYGRLLGGSSFVVVARTRAGR